MAKFSPLIALLLVLALAPGVAAGQTSVDCSKFWGAKAVFVGKVLRAYPGRGRSYEYVDGTKRPSDAPVLHVTLSVERAFTGFKHKGRRRPVEVECAACLKNGRPREGESYLVYAYGAGTKGGYPLATTVMTPASEAAAEIDSLRQITAPGTIAYELNSVGAGILSGKVISRPQPIYPEVAKASQTSGSVTVAIVLDPAGVVIRAEAVCGPPLLRAASEEAAKKIRYTPTKVTGRPVSMGGLVTYNFVLQ